MTRRLATICLVTLFLVGIAPAARAQDTQDTDVATPTMQGITALNVRVADLPDGAKVLGLTKEAIQTDVELKLRLAGVRVVTQEEDFKLPGMPFLYVEVNPGNSAGAAHIEVELRQNAQLERNGQRAFSVTTWRQGILIVGPTLQVIRGQIKDRVDEFLNAWLSVNPKK